MWCSLHAKIKCLTLNQGEEKLAVKQVVPLLKKERKAAIVTKSFHSRFQWSALGIGRGQSCRQNWAPVRLSRGEREREREREK